MSRPRKRGRDIDGVFLLDKPQGMSSNDIMQKVKRLFQANKAGHTGALDPLATGMLPICLGEATKFSQFLLDADKRYVVTAKLGERTDTSDAEGQVVKTRPVNVETSQILTALAVITVETFLYFYVISVLFSRSVAKQFYSQYSRYIDNAAGLIFIFFGIYLIYSGVQHALI